MNTSLEHNSLMLHRLGGGQSEPQSCLAEGGEVWSAHQLTDTHSRMQLCVVLSSRRGSVFPKLGPPTRKGCSWSRLKGGQVTMDVCLKLFNPVLEQGI